jgi:hypothetical protein
MSAVKNILLRTAELIEFYKLTYLCWKSCASQTEMSQFVMPASVNIAELWETQTPTKTISRWPDGKVRKISKCSKKTYYMQGFDNDSSTQLR